MNYYGGKCRVQNYRCSMTGDAWPLCIALLNFDLAFTCEASKFQLGRRHLLMNYLNYDFIPSYFILFEVHCKFGVGHNFILFLVQCKRNDCIGLKAQAPFNYKSV